ncbi:MAG: hypothetical protein JXA77_14835 [Bacteroidales bacterium]|nr:hypothetical protein [Bacteroidales bacterium]
MLTCKKAIIIPAKRVEKTDGDVNHVVLFDDIFLSLDDEILFPFPIDVEGTGLQA